MNWTLKALTTNSLMLTTTGMHYVDALLKNGITKGKTATEFGATANVKRGEFALFMYRAKDINGDETFTEVKSVEIATTLVDANTRGTVLVHSQ